jgi:hypothetical protein
MTSPDPITKERQIGEGSRTRQDSQVSGPDPSRENNMMPSTDMTSVATPLARLPLMFHWGGTHPPLPMRKVQLPPSSRRRTIDLQAPDWVQTGPRDEPFDFSRHVQALCADMVQRCDDLKHIDVSRLLFGMTQARSGRRHGLQARVTPLRFKRGGLLHQRRGVSYQVQRYVVDGREMLYLVTFCLPRFLDQSFDDKFITLFHELYHISPKFDGDLRRHGGRYDLHTHSKKEYDASMARMARSYLSRCTDARLHHWLRLDFPQLQHRHGTIVGVVVPRPKIVPVTMGQVSSAASNK